MDVEQISRLESYTPMVFIKNSDTYQNESSSLYPDESLKPFWDGVDALIREEFSECIDDLRGDADELVINNVEIPADDVPRVEYTLVYEDEKA